MPLRLILADDHPAFRVGVQAYLNAEPDIAVVGVAENGPEALRLALDLRPDVLLLDLEMPDLSGVEVTERLVETAPEVQVLILSAYESADYIFGVLQRGAAGYLTKQEPMSAIVEAVRGVAGGRTGWLSARIERLVAEGQPRRRRPAVYDELSPRERETFALLAHGLTNEEIADRLFVTVSTTKKHVVAIYDKLGVRTRAQAVAWAWKNDVADGDPEGPTAGGAARAC